MPIGVGAAVLIGSGIAGGTALAGAKLQSNAASKAAKTQQAATDKGLAVQQQAHQPYMDIGRRGLEQLQNPAFAQPYRPVFGSGAGSQAFGQPQQPQGAPMTLGGIGQQPQPQPQPMPPQGAQGRPMGVPAQGPQMSQGGGMVKLQGPDGSVREVPAHLAQALIARGARPMGQSLAQIG